MSGSEGSGWLLVPMEVSALVVGKDADDEGKKLHWSDLAPDYTKIWKDYALFGPDLVALFPEPGDKSLAPPDAGIHLHWLLPEAFGHGIDDGQGGVDYPDVPNRWLVRRVCYAPGTCDVRDLAGWIVESDFLHQTDSKRGTAGAVSMPVLARQMLFDSVGRVTALGEWSESSPAYRFRLTALGSGSPDFASFYPACKSVLGFHDPDPAGGAAGDWQVSYLVSGWCSDAEKDPLHGASDLASRLETLGWSAEGAKGEARILCHGAASRIAWNGDQVHGSRVPAGPATVCVGNSSTEALAALLARRMPADGADPARTEPLLAAFQYDMLGSGRYLGDVDAELHRHRFTSSPGGDLYVVDAKRKAPRPEDPIGAPEPPAVGAQLPPDVERALHDLNEQAREAGRLQRELGSLRQALYTTWCHWAKQTTDLEAEPVELTPALNDARDAVATAARNDQAARNQQEAARGALEADLAARLPDLELTRTTEPPFYRAADPAILIAGKGFAPAGVFDTCVRSEKLPCRWAVDVVTGLSVSISAASAAAEVSAERLFPLERLKPLPVSADAPPPALLDALLRELLVLDPVDPRVSDAVPPLADKALAEVEKHSTVELSDRVRAGLKRQIAEVLAGSEVLLTTNLASKTRLLSARSGVAPVRPDAVALARWTANPWRPLLLAWEVKWHPDPGLADDGELAAWKVWPLDKDGHDFQPPPGARAAISPLTYRSYTMLAPHAEWVLRRRLQALGKAKNCDVSPVITKLDGLEVLAQSLGGFHDALRQLRHGLQLPPINPAYVLNSTLPKLDPVAQPIDDHFPVLDPRHMHAPDLTHQAAGFQPIRAGCMELARLWIVDSFGQTRRLIDGGSGDCELIASTGLPGASPAAASPRLVPLPPRYAQPARLDFRWMSAAEKHPGGSPLCGWIFPNHLDKSLMVCDAAGRLRGALQRIIRTHLAGGTGGTQGASEKAFFWVPVPGTEGTPAELADPHLKAFVAHILKLGADAGTAFLQVVAAAQEDTAAAPEHDPRLSILVGRPLALVRASLRIELMGLPARSVHPTKGDPTRGFARMRFPVRLGGTEGDRGGLAGYFVDAEEPKAFHPRYGLKGTDYPQRVEYGYEIGLDAEHAVGLTLLLDPFAPVHALCGLLPRHSLRLPATVAAGASLVRDVFFQSAPVLGPPGEPRLPRPSDDYGQWSWAVRPRVTHWQEYAEITDSGDRCGFGQAPVELQEGWLKLAMSAVNIAVFWVKEGAIEVASGTIVTLGWIVEGADTLTLRVKDTDSTLASWSREKGADLPAEYRMAVLESARLVLTAADQQGNRSMKSLQLDVKQGAANG